ncbi:MAG TPA: sigma-70 family RNA polymerase sigma factor [Acidimicrobiales bacterium]|nr:sigma-70 family RNA polymerase sigma factor [Acidimicrobiales bacterium]
MDDAQLVARLQAGDEAAFEALVRRYHTSLLRLAETMVPSRAVAEEVVQETWLGVVRGVARFEGRSSLRTWLFHILVNRARSTGAREARRAPSQVQAEWVPAVDPARFGSDGAWVDPPTPWPDDIDDRLSATALADRVRTHLAELPEQQQQVVILRDIDGLDAAEVCQLLDISEGNQRVLLHRGRSRIRRMLADELGKG